MCYTVSLFVSAHWASSYVVIWQLLLYWFKTSCLMMCAWLKFNTFLWPQHAVLTFLSLFSYVFVNNNVFDFTNQNLIILTEKHLHQGYCFHILFKTFTKCYCHYKDPAEIWSKEYFTSMFYVDIIKKAKKLKSDTSNLKIVKSLKILFVK